MDRSEFYDYIIEHFSLGGTASRLVRNIIEYVDSQGFVDAKDSHTHLSSLLGGAFGLEKREIRLFRAQPCEICGGYMTDDHADDYQQDITICSVCADKKKEEF